MRVVIPLLMLLLDAAWLWVAIRLARGRWWGWIAKAFLGLEIGLLLVFQLNRAFAIELYRSFPRALMVSECLWHFGGMALSAVIALAYGAVLGTQACLRALRRDRGPNSKREAANERPASSLPTRRDFLGVAAAVVPPLFTIGLSGIALAQFALRVRRISVAIPDLPSDLDGFTIAQVTDLHVGEFTSERVLRSMVADVNELRPDLVVMTGDLIHRELEDLTRGLDLLRAMQGRFGHVMIEGNHDLLRDGPEFRRRARASGLSFLYNEATTLTVRGYPVQFLGLGWVGPLGPYNPPDELMAQSVRELLLLRQEGAFPILLAHHPHAFDAAAESNVPLTLSGHTHGGQWMVTEQMGPGPAMFRYWSGLYSRGSSNLVVSNGVGNVMPLRINAPAEVVHLTLRRPLGSHGVTF